MDSRLLSGIGAGPDSGSYTDLNRLNQLKVGKDRDGEANIRKVAQEFESLFLNEMLKSMRSANEALGDGNFMNSQTTKQYQDMYDQQLSVSLSKNAGGIGLADVLVRQLSKMKQGSRGNGENPFARVAENGAGRWPSNPSAQAGKALPMPEAGRDDSKLLNQRRLALPGKLTERMLAGIVPSASPAAVTHGSLTVSITEDPIVSQPGAFSNGQTAVVPRSRVNAEEETKPMFKFGPGTTLDDIVRAVNQVGAAPSDLMAILEALKQAGALQADLIVI